MNQRELTFLVYGEEPRLARAHQLDLLYDVIDEIDYVRASSDILEILSLCYRLLGPSGDRWLRNESLPFRWNFRDPEDAMLVKLSWETG